MRQSQTTDITSEQTESSSEKDGNLKAMEQVKQSNSGVVPRSYWFDNVAGIEREIWSPDDPDGEDPEYIFATLSRIGLVVSKARVIMEFAKLARWRFFQSSYGPYVLELCDPPRYVVLDDRAVYEILASQAFTGQTLGAFWPCDFDQCGMVHFDRPHRGRGAVSSVSATGQESYHFVASSSHNDRYYFSEEKGYVPVEYVVGIKHNDMRWIDDGVISYEAQRKLESGSDGVEIDRDEISDEAAEDAMDCETDERQLQYGSDKAQESETFYELISQLSLAQID